MILRNNEAICSGLADQAAVQGAEGITGGTWSANWVVTKSSKCAYLYQRLLAIGAAQPLHMLGVWPDPFTPSCPDAVTLLPFARRSPGRSA